ncbi:hypothetical protein CC86DRAFT_375114 [Ophiobolus disseminans]|uniref:Uncharacterized protein n=1 Tax=Ophiobolus disseminans TaxID=1469910 RepID=A0A6A6ZHA8_9PLEO|nr:hypothetical protein CC86DRAFT_375114 [Ophiobolus disseminans]
MATPQESITTVNGRRCTRSRARTLVPSVVTTQEPAIVTPTEVTITTPAEQAPQVQSSAVQAPAQAPSGPPPPPIPPPAAASSSSPAPVEQPVAAPTPTQVAVSSAIGTISAVPITPTPTPPLPEPVPIVPSGQVAARPKGPVEASRPAAVPSQVAVVTPDTPTASTPANSNTIPTAVLPPSPNRSTRQTPLVTVSGVTESAAPLSSLAAEPEQPSQIETPTEPTFINTPIAAQPPPQPTSILVPALPSGDSSSGVIGPDSGDLDGDGGLTLPTGDANIGSIAGGVIGGVAGLALVCALLFFCLRKRKTKQPRWVEKNVAGPRFVEKVKAIPAGVSVIFAKVKGMKSRPAQNPYRRHSQQDSISSIYSTTSNDQDGFFAAEAPVRRSSSRKSERNRLRKKNSSVSSQSTFERIIEEREREANNPFDDPEPPRLLRLSNPDPNQSPRGPVTPQPAMTPANPFTSPLDDRAVPPGWPEALPPILGHKRTQSSLSALGSHPPTLLFAGPGNTAAKGSSGPPPSSQAPPAQKRRSSIAYPTFDATSSGASGDSDFALYGEPGPSRPGTKLFTPGPTGRTVRQSDPFDLDRPEVLGFGSVVGRKEVRASVTRQATRGKRTSSVGNWSTTNDSPYPSIWPAGRRS